MKQHNEKVLSKVLPLRRIISIALIVFALMPLAAYAADPAPTIKATDSVNVRDKANLNGKVLGSVSKGKTAPYLGEYAADERGVIWYKITFKDGIGWVSSKFTEIENAVKPITPSMPGNSIKATESVNVRDKASLNGKVLGIVSKGQTAPYLVEQATDERGVVWYKIVFKDDTGWVSSKYSEVIPPK